MLAGVIIFIFVAIVFVAECLAKASTRTEAENDDDDNNNNQELGTIRQTMSERRRTTRGGDLPATTTPPLPSSAPPQVQDDVEQQRKELIHSSMFHQNIDRPESVRSLETVLQMARDRYHANNTSGGNAIARSWRAAATSVRTAGERECCICLDAYEAGETISWAKTDKCDHIFHQECAEMWLKDHDDCPLCRVKILLP